MIPWWQRAFRSLQGEAGLPPAGPGLRAVATLAARGYGVLSRGRRYLYDTGRLRRHRLPLPVISIGNLVVGGTGKTPLTALLASHYQAAGCRVAVISRGYGSTAKGVRIISDGEHLRYHPPLAGDEAYLLALKLPGIPIITGVDRCRAGFLAWETFQPDVLLLDDGFQHYQLARDLDVVLLDAAQPFGNGQLLPRGPLREPVEMLTRAQVLILTRYCEERHHYTWREITAAFPTAVVLRARFSVARALVAPTKRDVELAALASQRLAAVAGVARPAAFAANLQEMGLTLQRFFLFPDHYDFKPRDVAAITAAAQREGIQGLVTTEKDWVRLARVWNKALPLYVVPLEVELLDPWPAHLLPLACYGRAG